MTKCQECKCNSNTTSSNEFNKNLCDDCYSEYRVTIQHMLLTAMKDHMEIQMHEEYEDE